MDCIDCIVVDLLGHAVQQGAHARLLEAHDGVAEEATRAARRVARVRHEHRVLAQSMQADVLDRRPTSRGPAAHAVGLLMRGDPIAEDATRVRSLGGLET